MDGFLLHPIIEARMGGENAWLNAGKTSVQSDPGTSRAMGRGVVFVSAMGFVVGRKEKHLHTYIHV
jgi:hypothetical protein